MSNLNNNNKKSFKWKRSILHRNNLLKDVIQNLDDIAIKIVLIENELGELEGTILDGDVRRGLLNGLDLQSSIDTIINKNPIYVSKDSKIEFVKKLMIKHNIFQIPILDKNKKIEGLHLWEEINQVSRFENYMIIMAGGEGKRLYPYTQNCPKPMIEIKGKPMLEHIIMKAKSEGFYNFFISIYKLGHIIENYFEDGKKFGVNINYLKEKKPLGTAGSLTLFNKKTDLPVIISNGDVLTNVSYKDLLDYHISYNPSATMAVREYEWQNQFGVIEVNDIEIEKIIEKPKIINYINAGIYVISPSSFKFLNKNEFCDMPDFFNILKLNSNKTIVYPIHETWIDVGKPEDLRLAQTNIESN